MNERKIHGLIWRNYAAGFLLVLVSFSLIVIFIFNRWRLEVAKRELTVKAELLATQLEPTLRRGDPAAIRLLCDKLARVARSDILIVDERGRVLADTAESRQSINMFKNYLEEADVAAALSGETSARLDYDSDVNRKMTCVAVPIRGPGGAPAALKIADELDSALAALSSNKWTLVGGVSLNVLMLSSMAIALSRRLRHPILELLRRIGNVREGSARGAKPIIDVDEIARLADELDDLLADFERRMTDGSRTREESNVILQSMLEGVVAIDNDERIITINRAARKFLVVTEAVVEGRIMHETIRSADVQDFISRIIRTGVPNEKELSVYTSERRFLHLNGTSLKDSSGKVVGALVVLNDFTTIRKLENMRRDFVANVSHEIKTPLTAIKGSVETLLDGAIDSKRDAKRFFKIILKHTDRLNALVEDILNLSLIEDQTEKNQLQTSEVFVNNLLRNVIDLCQPKARNKKVELRIVNDESVVADLNQQLWERALINLVDNAIKFSDRNGIVELGVAEKDGWTKVRVADSGCGIAKGDLQRIFERFYMVNKARSKNLGGTGLGLSIVKHVAQIHGGSVEVESELGKGSAFVISIPSRLRANRVHA